MNLIEFDGPILRKSPLLESLVLNLVLKEVEILRRNSDWVQRWDEMTIASRKEVAGSRPVRAAKVMR